MTTIAPSLHDLFDRLAHDVGPEAGLTRDPDELAPCQQGWGAAFQGRAWALAMPRSALALSRLVACCHDMGIAMVPQGGNTGMTGACIPSPAGDQLVVRLDRMNRILSLDPIGQTMLLESGCVLADAQRAALEQGLVFPLSLGSEGSCQIGGLISTNAGGIHATRYGNMRALVLGLAAILPDGDIWDGIQALRKDNTGYDLKQLFIGAEGTLGILTAATIQLQPAPNIHATALLATADLARAIRVLIRLRRDPALSAIELIPDLAFTLLERHIAGASRPYPTSTPFHILVEMAESNHAAGAAVALQQRMEQSLAALLEDDEIEDAILANSEAQRLNLWRMRETIPEAVSHEGAVIKHDISVPIHAIPDLFRLAEAEARTICPDFRLIAFGHLGDGNIHYNLLQAPGADVPAFRAQIDSLNRAVHDVVVGLGGSISAEHGIGTLRRDALAHYKSDIALTMMRDIKRLFDPKCLMNPGKVL